MSEHAIRSHFETQIIPSRQVTDEQPLEVSSDLWGSTDYGLTAVSLLESERQHADTSVWAIDRGLNPKELANVAPRTEQEMAEIVLDMWDQKHYPFEPQVSYKKRERYYPALSIAEPGLLTRLRLADFSRNRGYDSHELHGTLGKTFDILTVASGVKKASDVGASHVETEFITAKELRMHLRNAELPQYYRNEINSRLVWAASGAVFHAQAPEYGEVVFEGPMKDPAGSGHKFERIAVSSLEAIARSFPEDRPTARALLSIVE